LAGLLSFTNVRVRGVDGKTKRRQTIKGRACIVTRAHGGKTHRAKTARRSVMPEQREQNDDRQRHAKHPQQNSASHTHQVLSSSKQISRLAPCKVSQTLSKNVEANVWFPTPECRRTLSCASRCITFKSFAGTIGPFV
jgi:hypothetical protein